ncbi:MAG: peptidylprolyl isomerase [Myxococcaceae bacterium]
MICLSLLLSSVLLLAACNNSGGTSMNFRHNKDGKGTKVATFGEDSITSEELKARLSEMSPFARARYQTVEQKKEYVDGVARFEMLAAEAQRRGLANDPEVVETAKKVMVQKLLQQELEERPNPVPDAQVAEYYEKHKTDYVKPEMVRLSHLFVGKDKKDKAVELLAKAKGLPPMDYQAFSLLVRENSEEPRTKPLDGDMRFLSKDDLSTQYGPEVAKAAEALTQVGTVAPELIETEKGFHIVKLGGRQAALNLTVDQVKTQIQTILIHERKMAHYQALLEGLKKSQAYKVDEALLGKIEVDMKAPAVEAKGPMPGFIPAPMPAQPMPTR